MEFSKELTASTDDSGHRNRICTMSSAYIKAFFMLMMKITKLKNLHPISFINSRMTQYINKNFIVDLNMSNYIENCTGATERTSSKLNGFNATFDLSNIKQLEPISGTTPVQIYDDEEYITFINGQTKAHLTKSTPSSPLTYPILGQATQLGSDVDNLPINSLKHFIGKTKRAYLYCIDDKLEKIHLEKRSKSYSLLTSNNICMDNQELTNIYLSKYSFAFAGIMDLSLSLWRNNQGTWLKTFSRPNFVDSLTTYELLCDYTNNNRGFPLQESSNGIYLRS